MTHLVFLLGGHDLEMQTIADMLKENRIEFHDNSLKWNNAAASCYKQQFEKYGNMPGVIIYGVELNYDITEIYSNYILIDHHGEYEERPSSLEQIALIIGVKMDRYMTLVAANDSRYIPGMKDAGASDDEIKEIREKDRAAQGVTAEIEDAAETAINTNLEDLKYLKIVKNAPKGSFSTICDLLYPYSSLVIYNESELCFYGKDAAAVRKFLTDDKKLSEAIYYGGGENGFFGIEKEVKKVILLIQQYYMNSYHVFYFPFKWEFEGNANSTFQKKFNTGQFAEMENSAGMWRHVTLKDNAFDKQKEAEELFAERQYFYKFVHPVLYDAGDENAQNNESNIVRHYERKEPQGSDNVRYIIEKNTSDDDISGIKTYNLKVDAINLNFYSTGIGILMFYLINDDPSLIKEEDIRDINQYGRRIMPPHCGEFEADNRRLLARSLRITGLDSDDGNKYSDGFRFSCSPKDYSEDKGFKDIWTPSRIIVNLIKDLFNETDRDKINIEPVIDDRMLVNCWYGNKELSDAIATGYPEDTSGIGMSEDVKNIWYKQIFIDEGGDSYCQNDRIRDRLISESTYSRWQKYGTLYGVSRYSMICISNTSLFSKNILATHIRTIYARLFELLIVQKASVLRFSGEVSEISSLNGKDEDKISENISSLYKEYIKFVNQIYFRSVTIQDQGVELYDLLSKQFDTEKQIKALDEEINELNQYAAFLTDEKRNKNGLYLNILAAFFLPVSLISGLLGMNTSFSNELGFWNAVLIVISFSIIFWIGIYLYFTNRHNH